MNVNTNTPAARALIQFAESMGITAIIAGVAAISPFLAGAGGIDWQQVGDIFFLAVLFSAAHSAVAYFRPYNVELSTVLGTVVDLLEKRVQTQQPVQGNTIPSPLVVIHQNGPTTSVEPLLAQGQPNELLTIQNPSGDAQHASDQTGLGVTAKLPIITPAPAQPQR